MRGPDAKRALGGAPDVSRGFGVGIRPALDGSMGRARREIKANTTNPSSMFRQTQGVPFFTIDTEINLIPQKDTRRRKGKKRKEYMTHRQHDYRTHEAYERKRGPRDGLKRA